MPEAMGATVIARVWKTLLTLVPTSSGPVAVQHAPFLALGRIGATAEPLSSIQYPTGTRAGLLASAGGFLASLPPLGDADSDFADHPELARLNADVLRFTELAPGRQAQVLSCLNCITEHRVAFRLIPALSTEYFADPAGCAALYEGARSLVRVRPHDRQSRTVLGRLTEQDANPRIATAAAIQLAAASIRHDGDLDAGRAALEIADRRRHEVDRTAHRFTATLLDSRYFRALALLSLRQRKFGVLASSLDSTWRTAEALFAEAPTQEPYLELVALENFRLVLEVQALAASGAKDPTRFATWATRLIETDPEDPYTWRYVAVYGSRCGLVFEAALAMSGLATIGTLGMTEAADALRSAPAPAASDRTLVATLLGALEALVAPDRPARAA